MSIATAENAWVNTIESRNPEVLQQAWEIITSTVYCSLSTCSPDGFPWASPVFFTFDSDLTLYWSSASVAKHSQNIYQNQGRVAIAIYSTDKSEGKGKGVYLNGLAHELEPEWVSTVMQSLFNRAGGEAPNRTAADYLHPSPRRMYKFTPEAAWITGQRLPLGNQLVDTKIQLDLTELQRWQSD
jgi:hypothetical protein